MLAFGYHVIECYDDEAPEAFGTYVGSPDLQVGDEIQLKWLDGSDAYKVKVIKRDGMELHVEAVPR